MGRPFDVTSVEAKWQARWFDEGTYEVDNDDVRERYYVLCMYPYPREPPTRVTCAITPLVTSWFAIKQCSIRPCCRQLV